MDTFRFNEEIGKDCDANRMVQVGKRLGIYEVRDIVRGTYKKSLHKSMEIEDKW